MPLDAIYSLTKHAVVGFVRSIAPLLAPIKVNAICPGIADTPMLDQHGQRAMFAGSGLPAAAPGGRRRGDVARRSEGTGETLFVFA